MAKRQSRPPQDDPEQSRRFIEVAREPGADREAPEFDAVPGRVAAQPKPDARKPKHEPKKRAPKP